MKDSMVAPVGLFDVRRQARLLRGLSQRIEHCLEQREQLSDDHRRQAAELEAVCQAERSDTLAVCRTDRREMLETWDQSEEALTRDYEKRAHESRIELNRLAVIYRRKIAEEKQTIERKVEARRQAVAQQYENRKNQPGQLKRKEIKQIDASLVSIHEDVQWARALTIRRLDRLPEVPARGASTDGDLEDDDDEMETDPETVQQAIDTVAVLTSKCRRVIEEMQSGTASKIVDSFYLPGGVAAFVVVWAIVAGLVAPYPPWLWMAAGVIPAGILGFTIYLILLWPLKRMTRRLYPRVERIARAAEHSAAIGRKVSADQAADAARELVSRRDAHLAAADRWRDEQLKESESRLTSEQASRRKELVESFEATDRRYSETFTSVSARMRAQADAVAQSISNRIAQTDQVADAKRAAAARLRSEQLQRLSKRLTDGVAGVMDRISSANEMVQDRFPAWPMVLGGQSPSHDHLDFLPIGALRVDGVLKGWLATGEGNDADSSSGANERNGDSHSRRSLLSDVAIPRSLPLVLHRRCHSALVIRSAPESMSQAIDAAHQILWRMLSASPAGLAKLTLLDPLGRGQNFTSFMALADHDPSLIGHRVWTDQQIDVRLVELAHHVEDVLQSSLRDRFERIEDYNVLAGSMAEPYRVIAAVGLPGGMSREGYGHLRALIESGLRCGIFSILVCDDSKPWPSDTPIPTGGNVLTIRVNQAGEFELQEDGLLDLPLEIASPPAVSLRPELIEMIGTDALAASRVEIPMDQLLLSDRYGQASSADGLAIIVGSQGANRSLSVKLGEGVRQHVLIAGKTGSGKSTLLHALITSGAHDYRPDQLQFYLLDFKKGVEFKAYADAGLPHARVIGIESEREFGRSVLQNLDGELQRRGERFRAAGVQELESFRESTGESMPRIMLVVDEFQELFIRDDRVASDCAMLLDRLVRQGRSFGMHVVLSSQSLAGAYSLPRATLGQMAVRIAMQCSESDASLILSDDNTAARLINRPGEAIYNDAGGLVEGNQPFQVAWLSSDHRDRWLDQIAQRDAEFTAALPPAVVFEGNRPCRWTPGLATAAIDAAMGQSNGSNAMAGLLGEAVEIGPPVTLQLSRDNGRNVLLIAPGQSLQSVIASLVSSLVKGHANYELVYFDGTRTDDGQSLAPWLNEAGMNPRVIKPRESQTEMNRLSDLIAARTDDPGSAPPVIVVVDPLERFRDLRQDESFNFSLDSPGTTGGGQAFQNVMRDGPPVGVFALVACGSAETFSRWLPRPSQHDLEWRILGLMNASDSSLLVDSPAASELSAATMLLYDDANGRVTKFRKCDLADASVVKDWLTEGV